MNVRIIILSEISQTGKDVSYDITYMQNLKEKDRNELIYKWKQTHRLREWTYSYQGRGEVS